MGDMIYRYEERRIGIMALAFGASFRKAHIESKWVSASRRGFGAGEPPDGANPMGKSAKVAESSTAAISYVEIRPGPALLSQLWEGRKTAPDPRLGRDA